MPQTRQGAAFGIKEASIPAASMLAGLSLPTVASLFGWRASFAGAAGVAAVVALSLPRPARLRSDAGAAAPDEVAAGARVATAAVVRFAIGAGLGTGAATATATFLVGGLVADGIGTSVAGTVLSVASLAGIATRLVVGWRADRPHVAPVRMVVALQALGALGLAGLALGGGLPLSVPSAVVAIGAGWGWTGLAFLAVVRANPTAPAAAAGVVLSGLGTGGALAPLAFGALVDAQSFGLAWAAAGVLMAAGAVLTASARHELAPAAHVG